MAELSNFLVAAIELSRKSNDTITTVTITIHSRPFKFASHDADTDVYSLLMQTYSLGCGALSKSD